MLFRTAASEPVDRVFLRLLSRPDSRDGLDPRHRHRLSCEAARLLGRSIAPGDENIPCRSDPAFTGLELRHLARVAHGSRRPRRKQQGLARQFARRVSVPIRHAPPPGGWEGVRLRKGRHDFENEKFRLLDNGDDILWSNDPRVGFSLTKSLLENAFSALGNEVTARFYETHRKEIETACLRAHARLPSATKVDLAGTFCLDGSAPRA
jgi:hypothetical protein